MSSVLRRKNQAENGRRAVGAAHKGPNIGVGACDILNGFGFSKKTQFIEMK